MYHLLPVAFWLLALGVIALWRFYLQSSVFHLPSSLFYYLPAMLSMLSMAIIRRIPRHTESVEQCFVVALLLGLAACVMPTVVALIVPVWLYLIYQNIFSFRSFLASLLGFACVALWAYVFAFFNLQPSFFILPSSILSNLPLWIPTASVLMAWLGTVLIRKHLRVR